MPTLHVPALIVLLLIPNTTWRDWYSAGGTHTSTPLQRQIANLLTGRGSCAMAVMNARTADTDKITPLAGARTLLAGSRLRSNSNEATAAIRLGYAALAENLPLSLNAAGIASHAEDAASAALLYTVPEQPPRHARGEFVVATLSAAQPDSVAQIETWRRQVASAGAHGALILASPNPSPSEYHALDQLTPLIVWQPGHSAATPDLLYSPSTRTDGLIASTDAAATIAALAGVQLVGPSFGSACEWRSASDAASASDALAALSAGAALQGRRQRAVPLLAGALSVMIALASILVVGKKTRSVGRIAVCAAACLPLILLCARNWQEAAMAWLGVWAVVSSIVLATEARLRRETSKNASTSAPPSDARRNAASGAVVLVYAGLALLLVAGDTLFNHARFTAGSLLGYSPLEGARYYGLGNEAMGITAGAVTVICGRLSVGSAITSKWPLLSNFLATALWGAAGLLFAAPNLGAKAGAVPVFAVGMAAFLLTARRTRETAGLDKTRGEPHTRGLSIHSAAIAALAAAALMAAAAVLLLLEKRSGATHVTQTIQQAQRFGSSVYGAIALRKAGMDAHLVIHSVWMLALTAAVAGAWLTMRGKPWRTAPLSAIAIQASATVLACLLFNDAGVVAASLCACAVWSNLLLTA